MIFHENLNKQIEKHLKGVDLSSQQFLNFFASISATYNNLDANKNIGISDLNSEELNRILDNLSLQFPINNLNEILVKLGKLSKSF